MQWSAATEWVETLRRDRSLWLPALTTRRGFSSTRIEHLLHGLVARLPAHECYLEVGTLEGRTLEAAAHGNETTPIVACDPGAKYGSRPRELPPHVAFHARPWEQTLALVPCPVGLAFYDADHDAAATTAFLHGVREVAATDCVVVLDDWDRETVRRGFFVAQEHDPRWRLLREMPEYTDGLTCPPNHFGWYFGCAVLGWRR